MNISTNNISFNGRYYLKDRNGIETTKTFTNDKEVISSLEKNLNRGKISNTAVSDCDENTLEASCMLNDKLKIRAIKSKPNSGTDELFLSITNSDKGQTEQLTFEDITRGVNEDLKEQLKTFITGFFDKINQIKIDAQQAINEHVIDLVSSK